MIAGDESDPFIEAERTIARCRVILS